MTRINSKSKGSKNEREVAKALSAWTGFEFARVPMSGGLGWKNRMQVTGDVIPTDPKDMVSFPFSVEAKSYASLDLEAPLLGNNCKWHEWWIQCSSDADQAHKWGLLIIRRNLMPKGEYFCVLDIDIFDSITDSLPKTFRNPRGYYNYNEELVIFPSKDLFRADYSIISKPLNQLLHETWSD